MRMTASWSGPWTHRIQGCGAIDTRPHAGSPLNVIPTTSIGPPCSELSRHGLANAERVERLVRRPTLTAPARAGFAMLRVENEETDSRSNKETDQESKKDRRSDRLTIKTPYKGLTRPETARAFSATMADFGRQRPRHLASPTAKPRIVRWHFGRLGPIPGDRDRALPRLRRQSRGKSKTIPAAPENRSCAGVRGGECSCNEPVSTGNSRQNAK
jgi:hypothetical protein